MTKMQVSNEEIGEYYALAFCIAFFPISKIIKLRVKVLTFKQKENKSLALSWDRFNNILDSGPNLHVQDPILLQHFYEGLDKNTLELLNTTVGGAFLSLPSSKARE